jgi:hypothetical protein
MTLLPLIAWFFGGMFLANAAPHVISGLTGRPFQSPFASPPGRGLSSSTVNILWGYLNLLVGYLLIAHVGLFDLRSLPDIAVSGGGAVVISLSLARHFGRFHGGNLEKRA